MRQQSDGDYTSPVMLQDGHKSVTKEEKMQIILSEEERRELEKSLIVDIDRWEYRLEQKRGTATESTLSHRIDLLKSVLGKVQRDES